MTIIVFLVDTSASMMQKTYLGTTYLDFARSVVEQFLKQRARDPSYKGDRYMLMTYEEYPRNVKSGWKESQAVLMEQLYNLRPNGVCDFLTSLESALRFVNLNRMQSGIDNYGYGRLPHCPEQVIIVSITDGLHFPKTGAANSEVKFPAYFSTIGSEMTVAPYRWDHRLFSIVLRFPGHYPNNSAQLMVTPPSTDDSIIQTMCAATGGRSFSIYLHKSLGYCIDTILQRIQYTGVLMRLEKRGPDPPPPKQQPPPNENGNGELPNGTSPGQNPAPSSSTIGDAWKSQVVSLLMNTRKHQGAGHWPIPESYWPDTKMTNLPPRDVHPLLCFRCEPHEPMILQNFPFDKYELENCALSQFMVERKEQDVCWQVFAENSSRSGDLGHPFGYLKLSSNMQSVTLFIMPYNYPMLLPLLDGPIKDPKMIESSSFRQKFDKYLATIPPYYYSKPIVENRYTQAISQPLKKALAKIKIAIPALEDFTTQIYNSHIVTLITKMKYHGKELFEKTCIEVARNLEMYPPVLYNAPQFVRATHCRLINSKKDKQDSQLPVAYQQYKTEIPQMFKDVNVCISESPMATIMPSMKFKNPFDIDRRNLLSQLEKMKINFDQQVDFKSLHVLEGGKPGQKIKLQHAEDLHNQPITKMGEYTEYVRQLALIGAAPLRELFDPPAKPHAFGNPFKLDKKSLAIDEVGEVNTESPNAANGGTGSNLSNNQDRRRNDLRGIGARRSASPMPFMTSSGVKRKPGPLDPMILNSWKRKRRSLSGSDFGSDTSSICSDDVDLDSVTGELTNGDENVITVDEDDDEEEKEDDDVSYLGEVRPSSSTDDMLSEVLGQITPSVNYSERSSAVNGVSQARDSVTQREESASVPVQRSSRSSFSSQRTTDSVKMNGHSSMNHHAHTREPTTSAGAVSTSARTSAPRRRQTTSTSVDEPTASASSKPAFVLNTKDLAGKQKQLSSIVRGVSDRFTVFDRCMDSVDHVSRPEKRILLNYAMREARRFKRHELVRQLERTLKTLK